LSSFNLDRSDRSLPRLTIEFLLFVASFNGDLHTTQSHLTQNNIGGSIPTEVGMMASMTKLYE
jgi:hypothetical protein